MENIIRRIISIEDEAQSIIRDAREAQKALNERVEADGRELEYRLRNKAAERCRKIQESEREGISGKIEAINAGTKAQLAGLEKKYRENKEKWVDDMVRHIIGV